MHVDLNELKILVTGASRGIGKAIAAELADSGADVAVHYFRHAAGARQLQKLYPGKVKLFSADLGSVIECRALFEAVLSKMNRIDVLVNNAGIFIESPLADSLDSWQEKWNQTLAVNLNAPGLLCRLAIGHFLKIGGGRIVNIASRAAFRGDTPEYLAYAASKGGLVALTRSIARGYGRQGIKAFVLAPGFVRTDMAQSFFERFGEQRVLDEINLNRLTEPSDVAALVVLLASGRADHATGSTIDINAASYVH